MRSIGFRGGGRRARTSRATWRAWPSSSCAIRTLRATAVKRSKISSRSESSAGVDSCARRSQRYRKWRDRGDRRSDSRRPERAMISAIQTDAGLYGAAADAADEILRDVYRQDVAKALNPLDKRDFVVIVQRIARALVGAT